MKSRSRHDVTGFGVGIRLVLLLALCDVSVTFQFQQTHIEVHEHKRQNVTGQNVKTHSVIECHVTCQQTRWCVGVNVSPERNTCQLLSEEVSDVTLLETAEHWSYLRMYHCNVSVINTIPGLIAA